MIGAFLSKISLDANIQRLHYSLEIGQRQAGIKRPVYSNGQAVKDDPDFSISLGAGWYFRQPEIEKWQRFAAETDGDLRNRQYHAGTTGGNECE